MGLNSGGGGIGRRYGDLNIGIDQFRAIFQITKEFPNISDAAVARAGFTRADVDVVYEVASLIDEHSVGVSLIEENSRGGGPIISIHFDEDDPWCAVSILGKEEDEPLGRIIRFDLLLKWRDMIELALSFLGSLESYLRTGFDEREIRTAARELESLSR